MQTYDLFMSNGLYFLLVFGYNWLYLMEMQTLLWQNSLARLITIGM